jgi:hypothetical protein
MIANIHREDKAKEEKKKNEEEKEYIMYQGEFRKRIYSLG